MSASPPPSFKGQGFVARLGHAVNGLRAAWRLEASVRTHAAATVAVTALLAASHAPAVWWAVMALTVGAVVSAELLNTAIEALADHLHPGHHPAIGVCKDVAAGAVLVTTLAALAVGAAFLLGHVLPWLGWRLV